MATDDKKGKTKDAVAEMTNWAQRVGKELQSAKRWQEDYQDLFFDPNTPKTYDEKVEVLKKSLNDINAGESGVLATTNAEYGLGQPFMTVGQKRYGIKRDSTLKPSL